MQQRIEGESGTRREITSGFRTPGNRFAISILAFKRIDGAIFPTAASRRSLGRVSVPMWPVALSGRLLIVGLVGRYPTNYLSLIHISMINLSIASANAPSAPGITGIHKSANSPIPVFYPFLSYASDTFQHIFVLSVRESTLPYMIFFLYQLL